MIIFWHEYDLRIHNNLALSKALEESHDLLPLFILDPKNFLGEASKVWLYHSLKNLQKDYKKLGSKLVLQKGYALLVLEQIIKKVKPSSLYYSTRFAPYLYKRDQKVCKKLEKMGVKCYSFNSNYLINPSDVFTKSKTPYSVFTPFWKNIEKNIEVKKQPAYPKKLGDSFLVKSDNLESLHLLPKKNWTKKIEKKWVIGSDGAKDVLKKFLKSISLYATYRDFPSVDKTSKLSPYLHFGEISPHEIVYSLKKKSSQKSAQIFLKELGWREFANYFLFHYPNVTDQNWNKKFDHFPWKTSSKLFKAWREGKTGYPIVDAGMKQLWQIGWMHNRVRMIVASFLIKDLLIDWRKGAQWFMETLVDADIAQNCMNWQWVAGCGPDAAPYFRIFNPVLQGEKFDPHGEYVKKYLPELSSLPSQWIHKPFLAPQDVLDKASLILGKDYPLPIIDHDRAKNIALKMYKKIK